MNRVENLQMAQSLAQEFSSRWKGSTPAKIPLFLFVAGFQGAGKTTLLEILEPRFGLAIISLDEVRQRLFDDGVPFSEDFVDIVDLTSDKMIKKAVEGNRSVGLDTNAVPTRMARYRNVLQQAGGFKYHTLSVFLDAPKEELERRVQTRQRIPRLYRGRVEELRASLERYGEIDRTAYDLCFDAFVLTSDEIARAVIQQIKTNLGK